MKKYRVALIGSNGKMGTICLDEISNHKNLEIVAKVNKNDDLDAVLSKTKPDLAIEFTSSKSVYTNVKIILKHKIKTIIGSSGLLPDQIDEIYDICKLNHIGVLLIPNFSLGMALIAKISYDFSKYYKDVFIFEYHHTKKVDTISGTARYCSKILNTSNIRSVRSDNFVAKHQITIAGEGERIILDHETFDRQSFKKGLSITLEKIFDLDHLIVGLENIL